VPLPGSQFRLEHADHLHGAGSRRSDSPGCRNQVTSRGRTIAMIEPIRQEVLAVLAELSEVAPEVRLGQLIANLSYLARGLSNESIWDMEDDELLSAARKHLEEWRARRGTAAVQSWTAAQRGGVEL